MTGPMLTRGQGARREAFDADFYSDLHEPGRYVSMTTVEQVEFEGRPCYKISLVRKTGGEDLEFYDVETGLKAGGIGTRESQMGPMNVTQFQSDYKKFGGLLVPTTLKQSAMGVQQVITLTAIEFDTVDPSVFDAAGPDQGAHRSDRRFDVGSCRRVLALAALALGRCSRRRCRTASRRSTRRGRRSATPISTRR